MLAASAARFDTGAPPQDEKRCRDYVLLGVTVKRLLSPFGPWGESSTISKTDRSSRRVTPSGLLPKKSPDDISEQFLCLTIKPRNHDAHEAEVFAIVKFSDRRTCMSHVVTLPPRRVLGELTVGWDRAMVCSPADPPMTSGHGHGVVLVAPPHGWVRGELPRRWLAGRGIDAALVMHPSPQFRFPGAMAAIEALAGGAPATWHFYPFPHDQYLIDMLHARGHRILIGLDDDYWHPSPWHPIGPRLDTLPQLEALLAAADGLVVTTAPIAAIVARFNASVAIVPNAVDLGAMPVPRPPRGGRGSRVGWSGWLGHQGDTAILEAPLRALFAVDPALMFIVAGETPVWAPRVPRVERDPRLLPPLAHYQRLARLGLDIFVIPLVDHPWNEARSMLKAFETAALGIPMIVSDVGPYRAVPDDVALKVRNTEAAWRAALEQMIADASLREMLAGRALTWVKDHHTIETTGPLWEAALA